MTYVHDIHDIIQVGTLCYINKYMTYDMGMARTFLMFFWVLRFTTFLLFMFPFTFTMSFVRQIIRVRQQSIGL